MMGCGGLLIVSHISRVVPQTDPHIRPLGALVSVCPSLQPRRVFLQLITTFSVLLLIFCLYFDFVSPLLSVFVFFSIISPSTGVLVLNDQHPSVQLWSAAICSKLKNISTTGNKTTRSFHLLSGKGKLNE